MSKFQVTALVLLSHVCALGTANADPIDNPGPFFWDTGAGALNFNKSSLLSGTVSPLSGYWDMELASNGDIVFNDMVIDSAAVGTTGYTAQLLVTSASSSGKIDASSGGWNTTMELRLRIRITGNNAGGSCLTPLLYADMIGQYTWDPITEDGELLLYSDGAVDEWLSVPAITVSCNNTAATINSAFGFGVTNEGRKIDRLKANVTDGPRGS